MHPRGIGRLGTAWLLAASPRLLPSADHGSLVPYPAPWRRGAEVRRPRKKGNAPSSIKCPPLTDDPSPFATAMLPHLTESIRTRQAPSMSVQYLIRVLNECFLAERPTLTAQQLYGHRVATIFAALKASLRLGNISPKQLVYYCKLLQDEIVRPHYYSWDRRHDHNRPCTRLVAAPRCCRLQEAATFYANAFGRLSANRPSRIAQTGCSGTYPLFQRSTL